MNLEICLGGMFRVEYVQHSIRVNIYLSLKISTNCCIHILNVGVLCISVLVIETLEFFFKVVDIVWDPFLSVLIRKKCFIACWDFSLQRRITK